MQDNLNIQSKASLYEAFRSAEAGGGRTLEWHEPPKHGEPGSIRRSPTRRPIVPAPSTAAFPTNKNLIDEIAAWEQHRYAINIKAKSEFHNLHRTITSVTYTLESD